MSTEISAEFSATQYKQTADQECNYFNRITGRREMAEAISQMTHVFALKELAEIKERKLYRHWKGRPVEPGSNQTLQGTWSEFCLLAVGRSDDQVDADLANYQAFGEEMLKAMQRAGIGYRQLRDLRRLPEDDRVTLAAAAESEDKDALLEAAEDLLARKGRQVKMLAADLTAEKKISAEAKKTIDVKDRLLADRIAELQQVRERSILVQTDPDEREDALRLEVSAMGVEAKRALNVRLGEGFKVMTETAKNDEELSQRRRFMAEQLCDIRAVIEGLQEQFNLPDSPDAVDGRPEWAPLPVPETDEASQS